MGYTHGYAWRIHPAEIENFQEKFKRASLMAKKAVERAKQAFIERGGRPEHIEICSPLGGEPVFNEKEVLFSGPKGCTCETMWLTNTTAKEAYRYSEFLYCYIPWTGYGSWFTKTDRFPYGCAVTTTLLCFAKVFGSDFKYWSDGKTDKNVRFGEEYDADEDWKIAKEVVK